MDAMSMAAQSPALLEANRRLYELRQKVRVNQRPAITQSDPTTNRRKFAWDGRRSLVAALPEHLGWGSAAETSALRTKLKRLVSSAAQAEASDRFAKAAPIIGPVSLKPDQRQASIDEVPNTESRQPRRACIRLYPSIAIGMLRQRQAAAGRVWLLLRHLDTEGRGWLRLDLIRDKLTNKHSKWHVCGRRQLRNLLRQGRGIFWEQDQERLWLKSVAKAAAALGVERLAGRPVALPVPVLLAGIAEARAHFYASFHSGRMKEVPDGQVGARSMPIARATLEQATGVGRRTQRCYEDRVGLIPQKNIAVGERLMPEVKQERAWKGGRAVFELRDRKGCQGRCGTTYLAWQLPNSYGGVHHPAPKGRQKRINRELADLFMKGMTGNDKGTVEAGRPDRRFCANGAQAARHYNRCSLRDLHWPSHEAGNRRIRIWHTIPALDG